MKFLSTPNSGASWRDPLIYVIDLEGDSSEVAHVEIVDTGSNSQIASFNLYGVTSAEIDIAPYIRKYVTKESVSNTKGVSISKAAVKSAVVVNGVSSASAVFYAASLENTRPGVLSTTPDNPRISLGESIHITLYGLSNVNISIQHIATKSHIRTYSIATNGLPVEFAYPLNAADNGLTAINVDIVIDGRRVDIWSYKYVSRENPSQQVVWYNSRGGVESYTFPKVERSCYEAILKGDNVVGRSTTWQLTSAYESPEEIARVEEMLFADNIYVSNNGAYQRVELLTRKLLHSAKNLQITIRQNEMKGGGL